MVNGSKMESKKYKPCLMLVLAVALLSGCGDGKKIPPLAEISGVVVAGGQPLSQVKVVFIPETVEGKVLDAPQPSTAVTDEAGKFTLLYLGDPNQRGAAIGSHRITMDDIRHHESRDEPMPFRFSQSLVNAGSTPLTFEVKEGGDTSVTLDISDHLVD